MNTDLISYYKKRAQEYEKIYYKPERQQDLAELATVLQRTFSNKNILEVACGTGYWTEKIARTASSILATDINETVIDVASTKEYSPAFVDFLATDMYNLPADFLREAIFGGFIWSHIPLQELSHFIDRLGGHIKGDGLVVIIDNNYVEGSNLPITETDDYGNTYQTRTLEDGSTHKVLKNFPEEGFIRKVLENKATDVCFQKLEYYWLLAYRPKQ